MTLYEDNKRVCARGITFINNQIVLIERYKKEGNQMLHYFTIPGGGVDIGESYEEAAIRETKEETTLETEIIQYLEREEYECGIVYWYLLRYISGTPKLGGEELERNNPDNYYEVVLINYDDVDKINILGKGKEILKKAYELYKKN